MRLIVACITLATASAHGGLTWPPPRNNYENVNPDNFSKQASSSYHDGGPCAGGTCLWFSEGCYAGCPNCSAKMPAAGNYFGNASCANPMEPTLPDKYMTWNIDKTSTFGDFTKYHPWRSPGHAPVLDPCGFAGGYTTAQSGGGQTPIGAHQGDLGSKLPPLEGVHTEWQAGGTAEVGFMLGANHGGGYLYSVCPKSEALTEKCLQAHSLTFASSNHTIRYLDGRPSIQIPATDVNEGTYPTGSIWRQNPIPACNCDGGDGCHGINATNSGGRRSYTDSAPPSPYGFACPTGTQFPVPFDYGYGQHIWNMAKHGPASPAWVITDKVNVPKDEGEYVLRWRWDVEQNPQIWTHCADIVVSKTAPAPTPHPIYQPTPAPAPSTYHCIHDKCVVGGSGGTSLAACQTMCGH